MPLTFVRRAITAGGAVLLGFAASLSGQSAPSEYRAFADSLDRLVELPSRSAPVTSLVLVRDRGTITLEGGRMYLLPSLGGRHVAAVYQGSGRFQLAPPSGSERMTLARRHKTPELDARFEELVLLFADSVAASLGPLPWTEAEVPGALRRRWREAIDFVSGWDQKALDPDVAAPLLNGEASRFFHAHMAGGGLGDPVAFQINPNDVESVQLLSRARGTGFTRYMEAAARFRPEGDSAPVTSDRRGGLRVSRYVLDATLDRTGMGDVSFTARATMDLVMGESRGPWLPLSIYGRLSVDSARWGDGTPAPFFKTKDAGVVWFRLGAPADAAAERVLHVWYGGDLVDRYGEWFYINSSSAWYPRPLDGRNLATFDITFHTPATYRLASVGRMADSVVDGRMLTTRWVADAPMRNAGFTLGQFEDFRLDEAGVPPVTVLWSERGHKEIARLALEMGEASAIPSSAGRKEVAADLAGSLKFFSHVFGPPPLDRFYASEIPGGHGEAFPGLVHLSWGTFVGLDNDQGVDEWFRAHEVAHQWWGIGVDFATYRDQWLSEGMSSFAGLWYLQTVRNDNKRYFRMLDRWRGDIARRSAEGGPISLGYRTATPETVSDYQTLVYYKGAWVMHMLRIMMLDLRTMNEDRFTRMMQDFYRTYQGGRASTDDLRRVAEKHMGVELGWFFDQWVHGTAVPTYRASHETTALPDGQVKLTVHVVQENVPDGFTAYVPVTVTLDGDRVLRTRVKVTGRETTADLPLLPGQPKRFTFNDLEGVLAIVK